MENLRKEKGITLVALSITIIVLMILAGITVSLLTGENGVITRSKEIRSNIEQAEIEGQEKINSLKGEETYTEDGTVILNDDNAPTINSMKITNITKDSFTVTVNVTETGSGLAKIEYSIDDGVHYITPNNNQSRSYTFTDLKTGYEEYKVKVKVTDVNNNSSFASKVIEKFKVGDYIDYTYDTAKNYVLTPEISGSTKNPADGINQTAGLKWRVLNVNDDRKMDLISETPTASPVFLKDSVGYNNCVYLLNDICAKQYSNSSLGATARSLTLEEIESKMTPLGIEARDKYVGPAGIQYNNGTKTYTGANTYYPNLYAKENGSGINTTTIKTDGLDKNEKYYTVPTTEKHSQANNGGLTVTEKYYYFGNTPTSFFYDTTFYELVLGTNTNYWLATRYAGCRPDYADFGLRYVYRNNMNGYILFDSSNRTNNDYGAYLRPVVSIEFDNIDMVAGKDENGRWSIENK